MPPIQRRRFVAALATGPFLRPAGYPQEPASVTADRSPKPLTLPPPASSDPVAHSVAENAFWAEIMSEHAAFFALMMPGAALSEPRAEAESFQRNFAAHREKARTTGVHQDNYREMNRAAVDLIRPFVAFKQRMLDAQTSGKIRTLVWPHYFAHTILEGERAGARLTNLSAGIVVMDYADVVDFWTGIVSDHAEFTAHLLDPKEQKLIDEALDASAVFQGLRLGNESRELRAAALVEALEDVIHFNEALESGVETGRIRSVMTPMFADHMRRESLKFADELRRAKMTPR